jgi:hypothetical protein
MAAPFRPNPGGLYGGIYFSKGQRGEAPVPPPIAQSVPTEVKAAVATAPVAQNVKEEENKDKGAAGAYIMVTWKRVLLLTTSKLQFI